MDPFTSTVNRISKIIDGPDGLLQRVSVLENNGTASPSRVILFSVLHSHNKTIKYKFLDFTGQ